MIKVVIFDFDGVLVDSNEAWAEIFGKAARASGVNEEFSYEDLKKHYGKSYIEVFKHAHPTFNEDGEVLETMYKNFMDLATSEDFSSSFNTFHGVKNSLTSLKEKFTLVVGSGNSKKLLNRFLDRLGLSKYFDLIISGDDVVNGKPNPDILIKAIEHFKVDPNEAVYVGDSAPDIMAAKKANMRSVAVLTGALSRKEAEDLHPDYIVEDATKVQEVLKCM